MKMMKATFDGKEYVHYMIADRQREIAVSITALRMLQNSPNGNKYMSFDCFSFSEIKEAKRQVEFLIPAVVRI